MSEETDDKKYLREDYITIPRAQHEALMAAAKVLDIVARGKDPSASESQSRPRRTRTKRSTWRAPRPSGAARCECPGGSSRSWAPWAP